MDQDVLTKDNPYVKSLFRSLDNMSCTIENMHKGYKPCLDGERYLTDAEVSNILKISRRTLQEYRNERVIPYMMLGGKVIYKESDIQKLLEKNLQPAFRIEDII